MSNFLLRCSGASLEYLDACPESERNKYTGIGAAIFLTATFSALTVFYACTTIFESLISNIIISIAWFFLIFNIDRLITMSMTKKGNILEEIFMASPRILIAVLIGITISIPLETILFKDKIKQQVLILKEESQRNVESLWKPVESPSVKGKMKRIDENNKLIVKFEDAKSDCLKSLMIAKKEFTEECNGRGGSGKVGIGPLCKQQKSLYDTELTRCEGIVRVNESRIASITQENNETEAEIKDIELLAKEKEKANAELAKESLKDIDDAYPEIQTLMSQYSNLWPIIQQDPVSRYAFYLIKAIFIFIELIPILIKILSNAGPYDMLVSEENAMFEENVEAYKKKQEALMKVGDFNSKVDLILLEIERRKLDFINEINVKFEKDFKLTASELVEKISVSWGRSNTAINIEPYTEKLNSHFKDQFGKFIYEKPDEDGEIKVKNKAKGYSEKNANKIIYSIASFFVISGGLSFILITFKDKSVLVTYFICFIVTWSVLAQIRNMIISKSIKPIEVNEKVFG